VSVAATQSFKQWLLKNNVGGHVLNNILCISIFFHRQAKVHSFSMSHWLKGNRCS